MSYNFAYLKSHFGKNLSETSLEDLYDLYEQALEYCWETSEGGKYRKDMKDLVRAISTEWKRRNHKYRPPYKEEYGK